MTMKEKYTVTFPKYACNFRIVLSQTWASFCQEWSLYHGCCTEKWDIGEKEKYF